MSRDRAYRRYQREKRYRRYRSIIQDWYGWEYRKDAYSWVNRNPYFKDLPLEKVIHEAIRRHQDNMPICSCPGCCNERRSPWNRGRFRLTMAERRAEDSAESQIGEIGAPRWPDVGTPADLWLDEQEELDHLSDYNLDPDWWSRVVLGIDTGED